MTNLNEHCVQIDDAIVVLKRHVQGMDVYNSMMKLSLLADLIERHRQLVTNEIEGLKSDTRSAESAYEREKVRADALDQEKDRWTNVQLPGWRKRVTDTERANDDLRRTNEALARNVDAARSTAIDLASERDEWKQDAATSERKLEASMEAHERTKSNLGSVAAELEEMRSQRDLLRDAYDNQKTLTRNALSESRKICDDFYELKKYAVGLELRVAELSIVDAESPVDPEFAEVEPFRDTMQKTVFFGDAEHPRTFSPIAIDPGSAEGDKTVISWVCTCGKRKSFEPPKNAYWSTNHKCACGAHLHLSPVGDD